MLIGFWRQWYKNGEIFSSEITKIASKRCWVYFSPKILIALELHIKMATLSMAPK